MLKVLSAIILYSLSAQLIAATIQGVRVHESPDATRICLLYTSPSPRDYAASRMPSSA